MPWVITATLTVFLPLAAVYSYVGWRMTRALSSITHRNRRDVRKRVLGVILFLNLLPFMALLAFWMGGRDAVRVFSGDVPILDIIIVYPFWFGLAITVEIFVVYLLTDLVKLALRPWYRKHKELLQKYEPRYYVGVAIVVALYTVAVIVVDTWTVRVVTHDVVLPRGAEGLHGLTIAQITDVQGDGRTDGTVLRRYVEKVNKLQPDYVFFAGDLVTSGTDWIDTTAHILGGLKAKYERIAAIGDHDMFSDRDMVYNALTRNGFEVIEDSTLIRSYNNVPFAVTVIKETYRDRVSDEEFAHAVKEADGVYKILLVHQPQERIVELARTAGYQLFIAGHTHGGGVAVGIPGIYLFAPAKVETRYVSGFYDVRGMLVSVSNGLGTTLAPIRFHAPAEITLLRLVRSENANS